MNTPRLHRPPSLPRCARSPLGLVFALLFSLTSLWASTDVPSTATADAWIGSAAPYANHNGSQLNTSNAKEIYIRFRLTVADFGSAPALAVKLVLSKISTTAGDVDVYATNNNWSEDLMTWNGTGGAAPPVVDPTVKLATLSVGTGTGPVEFTLEPSYISGAGEYTLCLRTTSTTDLIFSSKDGSTAPQLVVSIPQLFETADQPTDTEFRRTASEVVTAGNKYIERYKNSSDISYASAETDVDGIGYFDVTKQPYGAKGDGVIDDTLAIQRAVNEARDARVAVYFPEGHTFLVSAPIECVQGIVEFDATVGGFYPSATYQERWNHRDFSCILMGTPVSANRASVRLADSSPGFDSGLNPVPVFHFWSRGINYTIFTGTDCSGNTVVTESGNKPTVNWHAGNYNHLFRNIDINLGTGNPGAFGIDMAGAQGNAIENLTIEANGAYGGIRGLPEAGGNTSNVTIKGGKYGIDAYDSHLIGYTPVLVHCTIDANGDSNAVNSIRWNGSAAMVLVGCQIMGKGMQIDGPSMDSSGANTRGNLCIVDSTINLGVNGAAITGSRSVYMRNVYCKQVNPIATISTQYGDATPDIVVTSPGMWTQVKEFGEGAYMDQYVIPTKCGGPIWSPADSEGAETTPSYLNNSGYPSGNPATITTSIGTIDAMLPQEAVGILAKHKWPQVPYWLDPAALNVKVDYGARGDNATNDRDAFNLAINAADSSGNNLVFVPRGDYSMKRTLWLKPHTVLFGLHKNITRIKAQKDEFTNFYTTAPAPLIKSAAGAATDNKLIDLMLFVRQSEGNCYLLDWQSGQNSLVQNVNFDRRLTGPGDTINHIGEPIPAGFPMTKITGTGGGRWFGYNIQGSSAQTAGYRHLLISGTSQPLAFYMFNPETDTEGIYNVEIVNASNIDIFQSKFEGFHSPSIHMANSNHIRAFGFGGNVYTDANEAILEAEDCSDFLFASQAFQLNQNGTDPRLFKRVREKIATATVAETPGQKQFVLYRHGLAP